MTFNKYRDSMQRDRSVPTRVLRAQGLCGPWKW